MTDNGPGLGFWDAIRPYTGDVSKFERTSRGYSSDLTAIVECEAGSFFVKAMRNRPGGRRDQIERERLINPFVLSVSPSLRWSVDEDDWYVLGFEVVDGRHADFDPDSADIHAVVSVIDIVGQSEVPVIAQGWVEDRWDRYCDGMDHLLLRGNTLLHGDINPSNFLMSPIHGGAVLVDWAWPTVGAGFINPAIFVHQLISSGHTPEQAEGAARGCQAWRKASPEAVDVFAAASERMMRRRHERQQASWLLAMADAAAAWREYRSRPR